MRRNIFCRSIRVYTRGPDFYFGRLFLELKSNRVSRFVAPTSFNALDEHLLCDTREWQGHIQRTAQVGCEPHIFA